MSVINRMLQELEERHDDAVQKQLPGIVRAVPARLPATSRRSWAVLAFIALLLLSGALSWQFASAWKKKTIPQPLAVSPPQAIITEPQLQAAERLASLPVMPAQPPAQPAFDEPAPPPRAKKTVDAKSAPATFLVNANKELGEVSEPVAKVKPSVEPSNPAAYKQVSKEQRTENRYREALSLISQGRVGDAQVVLEDILRLDPRNLNARQVLLGMHVEAKRYGQAEQLLQEGLQLNLAPAALAVALARVQFERGDQSAAMATLEKYAPQAGGSGEYLSFYAAMLQQVGRHVEAIVAFQSALRTHPNQGNWLMGLGISLQAEKRFPEAEQAYIRARASPALTPELQAFVDQRLRQVQQGR